MFQTSWRNHKSGSVKRKLAGETKVETYEPQNQVRGSSTQTATPWPPHALSSPAASCSWALAAELPTAEKSCWLRGKKKNIPELSHGGLFYTLPDGWPLQGAEYEKHKRWGGRREDEEEEQQQQQQGRPSP
jgi:hypothetical protein